MAADQVFHRLQRRITLAERSYKEAFAELERLQCARTLSRRRPDHSRTPPQRPSRSTATPTRYGDTDIGFVPPLFRGLPPGPRRAASKPSLATPGYTPHSIAIGILLSVLCLRHTQYVDRPARSPPPLHLRRDGDSDRHPGRHGHRHHAGRHLSLHRHSHRERGVAIYRPVAGGDGEARRHEFRARPHLQRQRHRAHRIAVLQRHRGGPGLLPSQRSRSTWPWRR